MKLYELVDWLIDNRKIRGNPKAIAMAYEQTTKELLEMESQLTNLSEKVTPSNFIYLLNRYLNEEDRINIDYIDGKVKLIVLDNPMTYIDTPLLPFENQFYRLRHLLALEKKVSTILYLMENGDKAGLDPKKTYEIEYIKVDDSGKWHFEEKIDRGN